MPSGDRNGQANQKKRTRKDLLQAASRLLKQGRRPSLEEVAEEALVSRTTAYRYFPRVETLLLEASLDVAIPDAETLFRGADAQDPVARVQHVEAAFHEMMRANETQLRMMLAQSVERIARGDADGDLPRRQNRRSPLIEAALAPARDQFDPAALQRLARALALVIGTEAFIVFKDVLQIDDASARAVKHWAIRALVDAARKPATRV
ncbi:TetR/AcrR family transcriptional regulator [Humitalea sp. 24SJ18S-53]|uniref:TetR/AcrR family transcriptional regulator n=1 Tax=Humitalea sp. 24SJ18S-53 TaxID=3422307 RepID=UPI003D6708A8